MSPAGSATWTHPRATHVPIPVATAVSVFLCHTGQIVGDTPFHRIGTTLDHRGAHVVLPDPRQDLLGRYPQRGRPQVADTKQVVEVNHSLECSMRSTATVMRSMSPKQPHRAFRSERENTISNFRVELLTLDARESSRLEVQQQNEAAIRP